MEIKDSGERRELTCESWSLYIHISPSNKVYVGIAKDPKHRWRAKGNGYKGSTRIHNAIKKYGWDNFKHEIIFDNLTREQASNLEKEYIARYNSTDPRYGYNLTNGGYDGIMCDASAEKRRKTLLGHTVSDETKKKLSNAHSIDIICLDTLEVFKGAREASKYFNISASGICRCCNGKASNVGGFHFAKLSDYESMLIPQFKRKIRGKSIICVETGVIYNNQSEAAREYGVTSQAISHCCTGKVETCADKHWKFLEV